MNDVTVPTLPPPASVTVLATVPGEEVLTLGATIFRWCETGTHVRILSLTDVGLPQVRSSSPLAARRRHAAALARLGVLPGSTLRLGLRVDDVADRLAALTRLLEGELVTSELLALPTAAEDDGIDPAVHQVVRRAAQHAAASAARPLVLAGGRTDPLDLLSTPASRAAKRIAVEELLLDTDLEGRLTGAPRSLVAALSHEPERARVVRPAAPRLHRAPSGAGRAVA